jgi:hypothetical protein
MFDHVEQHTGSWDHPTTRRTCQTRFYSGTVTGSCAATLHFSLSSKNCSTQLKVNLLNSRTKLQTSDNYAPDIVGGRKARNAQATSTAPSP